MRDLCERSPNDTALPPLSPALSLYIDLLRFGAALVVVLTHIWPIAVPSHPLPWPGHASVVVFFVLSGLVIAHAARSGSGDARSFALRRCARIWSVAVPALALSGLVALASGGVGFGHAAPAVADLSSGLAAILLNLVSMGQLWSIDVNPPLNAPFWSLNFEVWYYAIFGLFVFAPRRWRMVLTLGVAAVAGPKILLLMPVWLLGVAVYHRPAHFLRSHVPSVAAASVLALTGVGVAAFIAVDGGVVIRSAMVARWPLWMAELHGSNQFVGDFVLGLLVAVHLAAAAQVPSLGRVLARFSGPIRAAAGGTFSLYLYHMPLAAGFGLLFPGSRWALIPSVLVGVYALAQVSERQLPTARRLVDVLWRTLARPFHPGLHPSSN